MKKKVAIAPFVALCLSLGLQSCAQKKSTGDAGHRQTAVTAYQLIDQDRTQEAISLIEGDLENDPDNKDLKVILASAYAHEAGVKVQNLWPTAKKVMAYSAKISWPTEPTAKVDVWFESMYSLSKMMTGVMDVYEDLLSVDEDKQALLDHAIALINESESQLNQGDITYRALLRVLLIKSILSHQLSRSFTRVGPDKECALDFSAIQSDLIKTGRTTESLFLDFASIMPKDKDNWAARSRSVSKSVDVLTMTTTSLILVDEITNGLGKKAVFSNLLGQWILCP